MKYNWLLEVSRLEVTIKLPLPSLPLPPSNSVVMLFALLNSTVLQPLLCACVCCLPAKPVTWIWN